MLYDDALDAAVDLHMVAGGPAETWCTGITDDIERLLRGRDYDDFVSFNYVQCASESVAKRAEAHLRSLGYLCDDDSPAAPESDGARGRAVYLYVFVRGSQRLTASGS